jgi:hypothetical protein
MKVVDVAICQADTYCQDEVSNIPSLHIVFQKFSIDGSSPLYQCQLPSTTTANTILPVASILLFLREPL